MGRILSLVVFALLLGVPALAQDFEHAAAAYERGDFTTARKAWRRLAEKGDAQSQFMLGALYATGKGVTRDHSEAAKWYLKAAKQGLAAAQNNLGFMYDRGLGVPQSDHDAVKWYIRAAEQGHSQAQNNLGVMYGTGRGVAQNNAKALKWFQLSADQGNPQARYNLSYLRNQEQPQVANRPPPKAHPVQSPREVSITEESVTPRQDLAPKPQQETQVATTSAAHGSGVVREKGEDVKIEAIVTKKVTKDLKVEEKKPALEPRPAPKTDDAGPVTALSKIQELKGGTAKPAPTPEPEVVKTLVVPKMPPAKSAIGKTPAPAPGPAAGTTLRNAPVGSEQITLTAKTEVAALVDTKPKATAKVQTGKSVKDDGVKDKARMKKAGKDKAPTYQIQLGAVRAETPAIAAKAAGRLERSYGQILDGRQVSTLRVDLGARGIFYRLRAGPFADIFAARETCDKFEARKQPCLVLRR